jgi:hypothetical protein
MTYADHKDHITEELQHIASPIMRYQMLLKVPLPQDWKVFIVNGTVSVGNVSQLMHNPDGCVTAESSYC